MANGKGRSFSPYQMMMGPMGIAPWLANQFRGNKPPTQTQGSNIAGTFQGAPGMGEAMGSPTDVTGSQGMNPVMQQLLENIPTGEGAAGGGPMKPYNELKREELDKWKLESGHFKEGEGQGTAANQYANWYNASVQADPHSAEMQAQGAAPTSSGATTGTPMSLRQTPQSAGGPLPAASAQPQPGQAGEEKQGPLQYMMGLGKKFKENYADFEKSWEKDAIAGGYMGDQTGDEEGAPWSSKDVPKDQWLKKEHGILVDKNDPDYKTKLAEMATKDGELDQEKYNQLIDQVNQQDSNPYMEKHKLGIRKGHEEDYGNSIFSKIQRYNPIGGAGLLERSGLNKYLYGHGKSLYDQWTGNTPQYGSEKP